MEALERPLDPSHDVSTRHLMRRLWREQLRFHRGKLLLILLLTGLTAGLTGLYPVVIDRAISMFVARDTRILYQVPIIVVIVTIGQSRRPILPDRRRPATRPHGHP